MRVVVVSGICVRGDAISAAAADQVEQLAAMPEIEHVALVTQLIDRPIASDVLVEGDPWKLLNSALVRRADVVIFHWGVFYDLFDAVTVVAAERRTAVHFHNMTPAELVAPEHRPTLHRSESQLQLLHLIGCDVWTESEFNRRTLLEAGLDEGRVRLVPITVEAPRALHSMPWAGTARFAAVGRLDPAKGLDVLLDAFAAARRRDERMELRILGSTRFGDPRYIRALHDRVDRTAGVELVADADDDELWRTYEWADVVVSPSFHEGLCVPVIEGYIANCRAIGTDAGNLPYIIRPPDPTVPAGDAEALSVALGEMAAALARGETSASDAARGIARAHSRVATRQAVRDAVFGVSPAGQQ